MMEVADKTARFFFELSQKAVVIGDMDSWHTIRWREEEKTETNVPY